MINLDSIFGPNETSLLSTDERYNGKFSGDELIALSYLHPDIKENEAVETIENTEILETDVMEKENKLPNITTGGAFPVMAVVGVLAPIVTPFIVRGVNELIKLIQKNKQSGGRLQPNNLYRGGNVQDVAHEWIEENQDELKEYEGELSERRGSNFYRGLKEIVKSAIQDIAADKFSLPNFQSSDVANAIANKVVPSTAKAVGSGKNLSQHLNSIDSVVKSTSKWALNKILKGSKVVNNLKDKDSVLRKELRNIVKDDDVLGSGDYWSDVKMKVKKVLQRVLPRFIHASATEIDNIIDIVLSKIGMKLEPKPQRKVMKQSFSGGMINDEDDGLPDNRLQKREPPYATGFVQDRYKQPENQTQLDRVYKPPKKGMYNKIGGRLSIARGVSKGQKKKPFQFPYYK